MAVGRTVVCTLAVLTMTALTMAVPTMAQAAELAALHATLAARAAAPAPAPAPLPHQTFIGTQLRARQQPQPMSKASWLSPRPAGSPEASFSGRAYLRPPERPLPAPDRAPGTPKPRPASANPPLGSLWPAIGYMPAFSVLTQVAAAAPTQWRIPTSSAALAA